MLRTLTSKKTHICNLFLLLGKLCLERLESSYHTTTKMFQSPYKSTIEALQGVFHVQVFCILCGYYIRYLCNS